MTNGTNKRKSRLRFRLTKKQEKSHNTSFGLVEGNSTITVNTMGYTDDSSEEKKCIEFPSSTITAFNSSSTKEVRIFVFNLNVQSLLNMHFACFIVRLLFCWASNIFCLLRTKNKKI